MLGSLLGATRRTRRIGLAYVDVHADFATPEESSTGSVASMCLAMAVGRGDSPPAMTIIITGIYDPVWLLEIEVIAVA